MLSKEVIIPIAAAFGIGVTGYLALNVSKAYKNTKNNIAFNYVYSRDENGNIIKEDISEKESSEVVAEVIDINDDTIHTPKFSKVDEAIVPFTIATEVD